MTPTIHFSLCESDTLNIVKDSTTDAHSNKGEDNTSYTDTPEDEEDRQTIVLPPKDYSNDE